MKFHRIALLILSCFLVTACGKGGDNKNSATQPPVSAQPPRPGNSQNGDEAASKAVVLELLDLVKAGDYSKVAPMIAYRGEDESREWKSPCNYLSPSEKVQVNKTCAKLGAMMRDMTSMDLHGYVSETESEGEWHVWKVSFSYNDGTDQEVTIALLKVSGEFLLGDIEG